MCTSSLAPPKAETNVEVLGASVKLPEYVQVLYVLESTTSTRIELPKSPAYFAAKRP